MHNSGNCSGQISKCREGTETTLAGIVKIAAQKNKKGYDAIFRDDGSFREFVILMKNGRRIEDADAKKMAVRDIDEIAVFPPIAGG